MLTKNKIKNLMPTGQTLPKNELIEQIQKFIGEYNDGHKNYKYVVVGLFISAGLTQRSAFDAFEKIQNLLTYSDSINGEKCHHCGDRWPMSDNVCPNCGDDLPF